MLAIFILPEAVQLVFSYGSAAKAVNDIHEHRVPYAKRANDPNEVLLLLEDYTAAVETAPMFFPLVARPYRDQRPLELQS